MIPSDLDLARLCAESYSASPSFDFIDDGLKSGTGVFVGIKKLPDLDVIIFRGSDDVEDWLRDFDAEMVDEPGLGRVHAGFLRGLHDVHAILDSYTRPNPVLTGHSLGAARAAIYGAILVNYFDTPAKIGLFGCPRPGAQALADSLAVVPSLPSYRNHSDPVPEIPLPLPPRLLYTHVRALIPCAGQVFKPIEDPFRDHDINSYVDAMEKAQGAAQDAK